MGTYQEGEIGRGCVFLKGRKKHANGNNMVESRKLMHDKESEWPREMWKAYLIPLRDH